MIKRNKTLTSVLILSLLFFYTHAQDKESTKVNNNEFNIVIDDIFAKTPMLYFPSYYLDNQMIVPYYDQSFYDFNATKVGLGYKHYFSNSGIRTKLSFGSKSDRNEYSNSGNSDEYSYLTTNFYLGYEWLLKFGKAHVFYGVEAFLNHEMLMSKSTYHNDNNVRTSESNFVKNGYGASPLLGVKYYITGSLSVSTEIKFNVEFYNGKTTYENSESSEVTETKNSGMKTKFGPLGQISVNIHF